MNEDIAQCREFWLWTDGSGHEDGIGGHSAQLFDDAGKEVALIMSGCTASSVYREEFKGLLAGLEIIHRNSAIVGLTVNWYGDNKSLVDGVLQLNMDRRKHGDLWYMFEYYEERYDIIATHVPRTHKMMQTVDLHASTMRKILKYYIDGI